MTISEQDNNNFAQKQLTRLIKMSKDYNDQTIPQKENFEKIYKKAKENNINLDNAKDFLKTLSKKELNTIKEYSYLTDKINISSLDKEGSYNLLLHHYEKFDFNNDGKVFDGNIRIRSLLPINIPDNEKKALVQTLDKMREKDKFITLLALNPPKIYVNNDGTLSTKENPQTMNKKNIEERINQILNPLPNQHREEELINIFTIFEKRFNVAYEKLIMNNIKKDIL